jgi:hypothetical protein
MLPTMSCWFCTESIKGIDPRHVALHPLRSTIIDVFLHVTMHALMQGSALTSTA